VIRPAYLAAALLTACGSVGNPAATDAPPAPTPDAPQPSADAATSDAPPADAQTCFGTGVVNVCLGAAPSQPLMFAAATAIDTSSTTMCVAALLASTGYCVISGTDVSITAALHAAGPNPLVIVASGSITVTQNGLVDVASHRSPAQLGAGADPRACVLGAAPVNSAGGAGGSFLGQGAGGASIPGGAGGVAGAAVTHVTQLRGGCPGQTGGISGPGTRAVGGHGGGAVYLIAGTKIDVAGEIDAAGEGGGGGAAGMIGGAGGGSGGMIGFDAPMVTASGILLASGAGGGGGSGMTGADNAPDPGVPMASNGGPGDTDHGGSTGGGGSPPSPATAGGGAPRTATTAGGGGGGGGAGLILAPPGADLGTLVSPVATTHAP
jgi:hypothetical protein